MCVALIGGMDRLEVNYKTEAKRLGIDIRVFTKSETNINSKLSYVDALVILTNKTSHQLKREVMSLAKSRKIPVFLYHSCGVCTLRNCLSCIKKYSAQGGSNICQS